VQECPRRAGTVCRWADDDSNVTGGWKKGVIKQCKGPMWADTSNVKLSGVLDAGAECSTEYTSKWAPRVSRYHAYREGVQSRYVEDY
jgi:hypothetical protein